MILVDTSVWVEFLRKGSSLQITDIVDLDEVVTCLPVVQEVLQGFDDQRAFQIAKEAMRSFPILESPMSEALFLEAVELFRSARRAGLTIRSSVDCLIAACALRTSVTVLHQDRDFDSLAQVAPLSVRRIDSRQALNREP